MHYYLINLRKLERIVLLKLWQNKEGQNLFEMLTKNDVPFSVSSCKKDNIFGKHLNDLKQISAFLISLGL